MKGLALDSGEFISADELNARWLPRKATEEEMSEKQPEAMQLPTLPFAVFDEFGQPCEDRVRDHFAASFEALRAQSNDNWQQYATEREETAQAVIERHRGEIKSLLNLLAKDRGELQALRAKIGQGVPVAWGRWEAIGLGDEPMRLVVKESAPTDHEKRIANWFRLYTPPAPRQRPLTDEQRARLLERLRRQAGWDGDGWDMAVIEAVEHHHNIGEKK